MIVKDLRSGLGQLIILADWLTPSNPLQRTSEQQAEVDAGTALLAL